MEKCSEQTCSSDASVRMTWTSGGWMSYCAYHAGKALLRLEAQGKRAVAGPLPTT